MIHKVVSTFLLLFSVTSFAQQDLKDSQAPVSTITDANWSEYKDMYKSSPLCEKEEITLWSCETTNEVHSLCSTQRVTKDSGYIQYRASKKGSPMFLFPESKKPPIGSFIYEISAGGSASLEFSTNGNVYSLVDSMREGSMIYITKSSDEIFCIKSSRTLQVNYTMKLMYEAGIWQR